MRRSIAEVSPEHRLAERGHGTEACCTLSSEAAWSCVSGLTSCRPGERGFVEEPHLPEAP